jgi:hypothetical protein
MQRAMPQPLCSQQQRRRLLLASAAVLLLFVACCCSFLLPVSGQLAFLIPSTCPAERFDISSLSCQACPANSALSPFDDERCRCDAGYAGTGVLADTYALACTDCAALGLAANRERTACMACATAGGSATFDPTTRECVCPTGWALGQFGSAPSRS